MEQYYYIQRMPNVNSTMNSTGVLATADEDFLPMHFGICLWLLAVILCLLGNLTETEDQRMERLGLNVLNIDPEKRKIMVQDALMSTKVAAYHQTDNIISLGVISNNIPLSSFKTYKKIGAMSSARSVASVEENDEESQLLEDLFLDSYDDVYSCMICLEPFLVGEDVSWSKTICCRHVFHKKCIEQWLTKHDDCPCCRALYLNTNNEQEKPKSNKADCLFRRDSENAETAQNVSFLIINGLLSMIRKSSYSLSIIPDESSMEEGENRTEREKRDNETVTKDEENCLII